MDGKIDYLDGIDEIEHLRKSCYTRNAHVDLGFRYYENETKCEDALICYQEKKSISVQDLCDGFGSCTIEQTLCSQQNSYPKPQDTVFEYRTSKLLSYCLPGLKTLQNLSGGCRYDSEFLGPGGKAPSKILLDLPELHQDCRHSYGELNVYMRCSGRCHGDTSCPLIKPPEETCINKERVFFGLTEDDELMVLLAMTGGGYTNTIFPCGNKNCVQYKDVCNLEDNCGDGSDEMNCSNHFQCLTSSQRIPIVAKCNGVVDCQDFSDECDDDCGTENHGVMAGNLLVKVSSWTIGGLATILNIVTIPKSVLGLKKVSSLPGAIIRCLVLLIAFGDFLMGVYLIVIAYVDHTLTEYCKNKYVWLSSTYCALLGFTSTTASQVSLFAMTALSITRVGSVGQMIPTSISGVKSKIKVLSISIGVVALSVFIAALPLVKSSEDYFGNGLYYHGNTLFKAQVSKDTHYKIFREFFGTSRAQDMSWQRIRALVDEMFTSEYGG